MNTRQAKKSDNSVAGGVEGGVAAAVNIPDLEDLVTKAVEAAVTVLRNELSKSLQDLKDYVADLEAHIKTLESRQGGTDNEQSDQPENNDIRKTLEAVREENLRTRVIANDSEQYGRRQNLRFRALRVKKTKIAAKLLPPSSTHDSGCRSQKMLLKSHILYRLVNRPIQLSKAFQPRFQNRW